MDVEQTVGAWEAAQDEPYRIELWRRRALIRAGYPTDAARELAICPDVDLHRACDMVASGCDPALAARILL